MSLRLLRLLVVVAGMATMATEMSASRMLQPFFGASILVWANVIGLILIYLSVGYWWGGRIADRHPHARGLCSITLGASIAITLIPFVGAPILRLTAAGFDTVSTGTLVGSFVGCLLVLSVPITMLGMVPPYAVRLAVDSVDESGRVSGSLYSLSTIGSIVGTFGSVLLLIPLVGTRRTFLVFAMLLAGLSLVGLWGHPRRARWGVGALVCMGVLMALPSGLVKNAQGHDRVLFERDSMYQFVQVVEDQSGTRYLQLNEGWAIHSAWNPDSPLTGNVWDHFIVLDDLPRTTHSPHDMLIIGNAAGSEAHIYRAYRPAVRITGVELDPVVSQVGSKYFDMDGDNLSVVQADGRPFLQASDRSWDIIVIDAYRQPYIPFYLTTREFFALVRQHLRPGGVVAINVGTSPGHDQIPDSIAATMHREFPSVFRYRAEEYNELILATEHHTPIHTLRQRIRMSDAYRHGELRRLFDRFADGLRSGEATAGTILTDDHAPVEWMTDQMITSEARSRDER